MHLLHIDSSIQGERSISRRLTARAAERWLEAHPGGTVTYRDLGADPLPHVDERTVGARMVSPDEHTPDQAASWQLSQELVGEIRDADTILLGLPLYNFGPPSAVKSWVDHLIAYGLSIDPETHEGLLGGRDMLVLAARGGGYGPGTPRDGLGSRGAVAAARPEPHRPGAALHHRRAHARRRQPGDGRAAAARGGEPRRGRARDRRAVGRRAWRPRRRASRGRSPRRPAAPAPSRPRSRARGCTSSSAGMRLRRSCAASSRSAASVASTAAPSRRARAACRRSICLRSSAGSMRRIGRGVSSSWTWRLTPTTTRSPWSILDCSSKAASAISRCGIALLHRVDHPAELVDAAEVVVGLRLELVGERLDEVRRRRAGRRSTRRPDSWATICCVRSAMRTASSVGQGERLVVGVRVQRLRAAEHAGERLDRRADDVVQRLLRGERHARRLHVGAHEQRALVLRAVRVAHLARPDPAGGAQLRDLLEEVDLRVEEEGQPRGERVDVEAALDRLLDVGEAVLERERELLRRGRAGLADVVAGDRDGVPARACCSEDHSIMSPSRRMAGSIGKHHSFCAMYSLRMSAWIVPLRRSAGTPAFSAATT